MSPLLRGVVLTVVQVALVGAVGAKLLYDRATLPRAWVETAGVDPDLPIRGRYVSLNLLLSAAPESAAITEDMACGRVELRDGRPVALLEQETRVLGVMSAAGPQCFARRADAGDGKWLLWQPVAFFLPEHAPDPTRDVRPGELWIEVTLPPHGAPRPIRLGLMRGGEIQPI